MEFVKRGAWRYACVACTACQEIKELRIDFWNKLVKQEKKYICRTCGAKNRLTKHGFSINIRNPKDESNWLYRRWQNMKKRCSSYETYVKRGIKVCEDWDQDFLSFKTWAESFGASEDLELDRIDNDKNYCPDNCRWVSHKENCRSGGRSGKFKKIL